MESKLERVRFYILNELETTRDEIVTRELQDRVEDIEYLLGEMEYVNNSYDSILTAYGMIETDEERSILDESLRVLNEHELDIYDRVGDYLID